MGGNYPENGGQIAVDSQGSAYVTCSTLSLDFPVTTQFAPLSNVFATPVLLKIDAAGDRIVYSDALYFEEVHGLAIGDDGSVYLGGSVYPSTPPPAGQEPRTDGMIRKIDPLGGAITYSVSLGSAGADRILDLALDRFGQVYVTGVTDSDAFPNVDGLDPFLKPADGRYSLEGFVTKLSNDAQVIQFSTFLGGTENDMPAAIAVDDVENAYVVGTTLSVDFPIAHAFQSSPPNGAFQHGFFTAIATRTSVPPPVLEHVIELKGGAQKYRLRIEGENLMENASVFIGSDTQPWPNVRVTSKGLLLGAGRTLKSRFPAGVAVPIRMVNPDGGSSTIVFTSAASQELVRNDTPLQ